MKAFIILNPASGKSSGAVVREAISRYFTGSRIDYEIHETIKEDKPGYIVRAQLRDSFDIVVVAGVMEQYQPSSTDLPEAPSRLVLSLLVCDSFTPCSLKILWAKRKRLGTSVLPNDLN